MPTTPSSARACWNTWAHWSRPTCRRSRCRSRCARSTRGCSRPSRRNRSNAMAGPRPPRIVLGVSGGIAAYKACEVLRGLTETGHDVRVIPTRSALRFVGTATWAALSGEPVSTEVWDDVHEVPHVQLGQRADLVVVVPATADLLS